MKYPIFSVFGVEMEYMIVDRHTLDVRPIADELMKLTTGAYVSDHENGRIDWSNELVNHVLEIKTHTPEAALAGLSADFSLNVQEINSKLESFNAMLLPTGAHPWMDPYTETRLWPHEHREVYNLYNSIFDCRGHGWSNLQSTHINLPFQGDEEFRRLHAAIRMLLPIIPALSASTPFLDGKFTGFLDSRLETYRKNQQRFPIITGLVIPEAVYSREAYHAEIFEPIKETIRPYDKDKILDHHFLNSRGAIARFDRGAIEIRTIDIQECPAADLCILELIVAVLKKLALEEYRDKNQFDEFPTQQLSDILLGVIREAEDYIITDSAFLSVFGIRQNKMKARELWYTLFESCKDQLSAPAMEDCKIILTEGSLSSRILRHTGRSPEKEGIQEVYRQLANNLKLNQLFV